jgi:hypothetical protein
MSPGGRHGHKVRELKRRMDAVRAEERAAREPPPAPVSAEHAALHHRIERSIAGLLDPDDPESTEIDKRIEEDPDLANIAVKCLVQIFHCLFAQDRGRWVLTEVALVARMGSASVVPVMRVLRLRSAFATSRSRL